MKLLEDRVKQLELENQHLKGLVADLARRLEVVESRGRHVTRVPVDVTTLRNIGFQISGGE